MQISTIDNKTNFNGIYKIPKTGSNISEIGTKILPEYYSLKDEPVFLFSGSNPFNSVLDRMSSAIVNKLGGCYSVDWLKFNAERFGANISDFGEEVLHIITGKTDIEKFEQYTASRVKAAKKEASLLKIFTEMFKKEKVPFDKQTPKYLRPLFYALQSNRKETTAFEEFTQNKVISVKTPQELLDKMLMEK